MQAVASNNANEETGKFQEGGTALITYGNMIQQFDSEGSGCDDLDLGRWTYMRFIGDDKLITQVVCRFSPCVIIGAALEIFLPEKKSWIPRTQKNRNKKNKQAEPTEQLGTSPKLLIFDFDDGNQNTRQGPYYTMLPS